MMTMTKKLLDRKKIKKYRRYIYFILEKPQLLDLLFMGFVCIIGFIIIKLYYPYPATMSDSGGYVIGAKQDVFSFYRPFGYSMFLQFMHSISSSINAVFIIQTLLYFISTAFFALSIKFYFPPNNKYLWYLLLFFLIFSPSAFFMANSIMSDILFASLIYFLLTGFIFIVMQKSWIGLIVYSISLLFSLHVRYSAMIFPFIMIPFFFFLKGKEKWLYVVISIVIFFIFHSQIKKNMNNTIGFNQFSTGFDGWQMANNSLHIIPFINLKPQDISNTEIRNMHNFMLPFKDKILENTKNGKDVTAWFLWGNDMPLKQYLFKYIEITYQPYPKAWVYLGSGLFRDYGKYLMLHYPLEFMRYYYLPNALYMFYPKHTGIMREYVPLNGQKDIVDYYSLSEREKLDCRKDIYGDYLAKWISVSHILIWVIIGVIAIIACININKIKFDKQEKILFWGLFVFGGINYCSTIFASPVELRYWLPMSCIQFSFCYILLNKIKKEDSDKHLIKIKNKHEK